MLCIASTLVLAAAAWQPAARLGSRPNAAVASATSRWGHGGVRMLQAGAAGGGMVDGARIGPPPDMPSLLLSNRIVYVGLPFVSAVTELLVSELLYLQYDAQEKPIIMYINSPGTTTEQGLLAGAESEAFAVIDTMNYVSPPIQTVLVGKAYGHAAMLLASGQKGMRSALPYGTVMLHQPRGQAARGQASDIAIRAREVLQNRNIALEIMAEATGVPYETLARDTDRCKYMDAQQALEYGIVDKVITKSNLAEVSNFDDMSSLARGIG